MPSRKSVERIDCQDVPPRVGNRVKLQKKADEKMYCAKNIKNLESPKMSL